MLAGASPDRTPSARVRSAFYEEIDAAILKAVARPDHPELAGSEGLQEDRLGGRAQTRHNPAHVLPDRQIDHGVAISVRRSGALRLQSGWNDRLQYLADAAREGRVLLHDRERGVHRPATLMPHDEHKRDAQFGHGILDAAERRRVHRVPRIAHDEEFAQSASEQKLGWHA